MIGSFRAAIAALGLGTIIFAGLVLTRTVGSTVAFPEAIFPVATKSLQSKPLAASAVSVSAAEVSRPDAEIAAIPSANHNRPAASRTLHMAAPPEIAATAADAKLTSESKALLLVTRVYRPNIVVAKDLERLIRPLLTQGVGTVVATAVETAQEPRGSLAEGDPHRQLSVLLVRDLPEVVRQVDAMILELETPIARFPAEPRRTAMPAIVPRSHAIE